MASSKGDKSCLICDQKGSQHYTSLFGKSENSLSYKNQPENTEKDEVCLEPELAVLFVLRKLLGISKDVCTNLIQSNGNPSSWDVNFCSLCTRIISEARFVFVRIKSLARDFDKLSKELRAVAQASIELCEEDADLSRSRSQATRRASRGRGQGRKSEGPSKPSTEASITIRQQLSKPLPLHKTRQDSENLDKVPDIPNEITTSSISTISTTKNNENINDNDSDVEDIVLGGFHSDHEDDEDNNEDVETDSENYEFRFVNGKVMCPKSKCSRVFKSVYLVKAHIKRFHYGIINPYDCKLCDKKFRRVPHLERHLKLYHEDAEIDYEEGNDSQTKDFAVSDLADDGAEELSRRSLRQRKTTTGSNSEPSVSDIKVEVLDTEGDGYDSSNAYAISPDWQPSEDSNDDDNDDNDYKDTDFKVKVKESRVKRTPVKKIQTNYEHGFRKRPVRFNVRNQSQHKCTECKSIFREQYLLDVHILKKHYGDPKPYSCDLCPQRFGKMAGLLIHKTRVHSSFTPMNSTLSEEADANLNESGVIGIKSSDYLAMDVDPLAEPQPVQLNVEYSSENLKLLELIDESKGGMQCEQCKQLFKCELRLQAHRRQKHLGVQEKEHPFVCPVPTCRKDFNRYHSMFEHIHRHLNQSTFYKCSQPGCKKWYHKDVDRQAHEQKVHKGVKKPFKCAKCGRKFTARYNLLDHMKNIHKASDATYHAKTGTYAEAETGVEIKADLNLRKNLKLPLIFKCTKCQLRFPSRLSVEGHLRKVHYNMKSSFPCPDCNQRFLTEADLSKHMKKGHMPKRRKNTDPPYCTDCKKMFKNHQSLKHHRFVKHEKFKEDRCNFMCEFCSRSFTMERYLEYHQKSEHHKELGVNPLTCSYCQLVLNNPRSLDNHIKLLHTKEYKYTCPYCPQGFMFKGTYEEHVRVHTGENPFQCPHCPKSFPKKNYFRNHVRTHAESKPFKCKHEGCGKGFSDTSTFKRHMETHGSTVHECPTCQKQFKVWHSFRLHLKVHGTAPPSKAKGGIRLTKVQAPALANVDENSSQNFIEMPQPEVVVRHSLPGEDNVHSPINNVGSSVEEPEIFPALVNVVSNSPFLS